MNRLGPPRAPTIFGPPNSPPQPSLEKELGQEPKKRTQIQSCKSGRKPPPPEAFVTSHHQPSCTSRRLRPGGAGCLKQAFWRSLKLQDIVVSLLRSTGYIQGQDPKESRLDAALVVCGDRLGRRRLDSESEQTVQTSKDPCMAGQVCFLTDVGELMVSLTQLHPREINGVRAR